MVRLARSSMTMILTEAEGISPIYGLKRSYQLQDLCSNHLPHRLEQKQKTCADLGALLD